MKYAMLFIVIASFLFTSSFIPSSAAETYRVMQYRKSFPPFYFDKGNPRTGIVRDIFAALAKETGDSFEFVRVPFKRALYKFDAGEVDIEPMANPAWRKNSIVPGLYSIPFAVSEQIVLYNAKYYKTAVFPEELLGETIGTVSGYTYPTFGPYFESGKLKAYALKDENKLVQMVLAGRLEQAIMNKDFALFAIKELGAEEQLVISKPCDTVDIMIRFHPSKRKAVSKFNKALKRLMSDGTIDKIYNKYR
jgi:polar amino acid transport system substrate-binding protein